LKSDAPDDRWTAARALAVRGDVGALCEALAVEKNGRVRTAILTGLAQIATLESADAVIPYIRSEEANIRAEALDALRAMADATKPRLPTLLRDPDPDVRLLACEIVRNVKGGDASALLCDLLAAETEKNVCAAAIEVLAEVGTEQALPVLGRCGERFKDDAFMNFAISVAADRLRARPTS
jgi:HEAT repeat protein